MNLCTSLINAKERLRPVETVTTSVMGFKFIEKKSETGEIKVEKISQLCDGFVIDNILDFQLAEILSYLYLGSQDPALDIALLESNGITHVLSVGVDLPLPLNLPFNIKYSKVNLLDEPEAHLMNVLEDSIKFIDNVLKENKNHKIFVHCNAGYSRAPSIVVGYLMKTFGWTLDEALKQVNNKRKVKPNEGFMKQLKQYENDLNLLK